MNQLEHISSQRTLGRRSHPRSVSLVYLPSLSLLLLLLGPLDGANAQQYVPQPVRRAASVQWNNTWYIQGGFYSEFMSSFFSLDLSTNWTTSSPPWKSLPSGSVASHFALVATKDGRIWSVGNGLKQEMFSVFNLSTNGPWQALPAGVPMYTRGLEGHAAVVVPNDDKIYIVGGFSNTTRAVAGSPLTFTTNLISVFQTTEPNAFVQPGPTQAQTGTTSWNDMGWAWLSKKQVALFFGGTRALPGAPVVPLGALQQFVPSKNEWSTMETTGVPSARLDHCMAANAEGSKVVVFGGTDGTNYLSDIHILDTATNTWSQGPPATQPRTRMVCTIHNNQLIAWGGSHDRAPTTITDATPIIFNLNTNTWATSFTASAINTQPGSDQDPNKDSPKPPSPSPAGGSGVPLGAIIGGAVGGVLLLALVLFLLYRRSRRRATGVSDGQKNNNSSNGRKQNQNKHHSEMRGYPDSQGMSGTSFYDGGPGANPVRASSQNAHRQPYQPSHQYYYTPPEYDHFTPDGASPSQPAQPLDDGSVSSGSRRPYTPVTEQSTYEHYYNAAGVATAAAANPRNDLEAANLMHVYEPPDNAPSTVASPLANLNTASTRSVGTGKASYSSPSPSSTHATSRSAQPLIDPTNPRINRATRPGASSTQTSPDRYAPTPCAPIEGSDPKYFQAGIGSYGPGAHGAVDDRRRPQSLLSDSSAGSSRASTSPQYIPPGPGRNSQWFGSPQDYGGGKAPIIHSTKGSRWSESAMTESEMSGNAGWQQQHQQQQQPMVWGNQNYSQGGNQYSTNDNITNYNNNNYYNNSNNSYQAEGSRRANSGSTGQRGGAVASRSARYKDPREAMYEQPAQDFVPPPPTNPRNWG